MGGCQRGKLPNNKAQAHCLSFLTSLTIALAGIAIQNIAISIAPWCKHFGTAKTLHITSPSFFSPETKQSERTTETSTKSPSWCTSVPIRSMITRRAALMYRYFHSCQGISGPPPKTNAPPGTEVKAREVVGSSSWRWLLLSWWCG